MSTVSLPEPEENHQGNNEHKKWERETTNEDVDILRVVWLLKIKQKQSSVMIFLNCLIFFP